MNFNDLLQDHDYYASDSNYYSNDARTIWNNFDEFYASYIDADIDMNLIYRWDIKKDDNGNLYMEIFIIKQRKGIYAPQFIHNVSEKDFDKIKELLQPHLDKLTNIWLPFSVSKQLPLTTEHAVKILKEPKKYTKEDMQKAWKASEQNIRT